MKSLKTHKITHVCLTPSLLSIRGNLKHNTIQQNTPLEQLERDLPELQEIQLGGEKMNNCDVLSFSFFKQLKVVNTYGLTECCVYQTCLDLNEVQGYENVQR